MLHIHAYTLASDAEEGGTAAPCSDRSPSWPTSPLIAINVDQGFGRTFLPPLFMPFCLTMIVGKFPYLCFAIHIKNAGRKY